LTSWLLTDQNLLEATHSETESLFVQKGSAKGVAAACYKCIDALKVLYLNETEVTADVLNVAASQGRLLGLHLLNCTFPKNPVGASLEVLAKTEAEGLAFRTALAQLVLRCKGLRWLYIGGYRAGNSEPVGLEFFEALRGGAGANLEVLWFGNTKKILLQEEEGALLSLARLRLLVACPNARNELKPMLGPDPFKIRQARKAPPVVAEGEEKEKDREEALDDDGSGQAPEAERGEHPDDEGSGEALGDKGSGEGKCKEEKNKAKEKKKEEEEKKEEAKAKEKEKEEKQEEAKAKEKEEKKEEEEAKAKAKEKEEEEAKVKEKEEKKEKKKEEEEEEEAKEKEEKKEEEAKEKEEKKEEEAKAKEKKKEEEEEKAKEKEEAKAKAKEKEEKEEEKKEEKKEEEEKKKKEKEEHKRKRDQTEAAQIEDLHTKKTKLDQDRVAKDQYHKNALGVHKVWQERQKATEEAASREEDSEKRKRKETDEAKDREEFFSNSWPVKIRDAPKEEREEALDDDSSGPVKKKRKRNRKKKTNAPIIACPSTPSFSAQMRRSRLLAAFAQKKKEIFSDSWRVKIREAPNEEKEEALDDDGSGPVKKKRKRNRKKKTKPPIIACPSTPSFSAQMRPRLLAAFAQKKKELLLEGARGQNERIGSTTEEEQLQEKGRRGRCLLRLEAF
jgi:hypothetical protein